MAIKWISCASEPATVRWIAEVLQAFAAGHLVRHARAAIEGAKNPGGTFALHQRRPSIVEGPSIP